MKASGRTIALRPATHTDLDLAWRFYRDAMKPLTEEVLEWKEDRQKAVVTAALAGGETEIVVVDGREAGWLQLRESDDALELCQIYIAPELQGQGIGTALIKCLLKQARRRGKDVTLAVMRNNRAQALYARLGFATTGGDDVKLIMRWNGE